MLKNKIIFLYSPQAWGKMRLSKHHYAIELVKRGNIVYYIEKPENTNKKVKVVELEEQKGLFIVNSGTKGIQNRHVRMKFPFFFDYLVKINTKKIFKKIGKRPDIVWTFDLNGYINFHLFKNALKISQPVDFVDPRNLERVKAVDFIFSVATEILNPLKKYCANTYFINHGVSEKLINQFNVAPKHVLKNSRTKIAYVGNLLRTDIAHNEILSVIKSNKEFEFNFIGNYKASNISAIIIERCANFITALKSLPNVKLLGVLNTTKLAVRLHEMDAFMICYDEERDMCKGTNYHKILEYLATGKVLISNHVSTYEGLGLFEMTEKHQLSENYNKLFSKVTSDLDFYNSIELQNKRIEFAKEHTYQKQIDKIDQILNENTSLG